MLRLLGLLARRGASTIGVVLVVSVAVCNAVDADLTYIASTVNFTQSRKARFLNIYIRTIANRYRRGLEYTSGGYKLVNSLKGLAQLDVLVSLGLKQNMRLLEIGCGALDLASAAIPFLDSDSFACVEPNAEHIEAALIMRPGLLRDVLAKRALFAFRDDFDGWMISGGKPFDFIFSHSILSHAAWWQLGLYLQKTLRLLAPAGLSVASINMHRGEVSDPRCLVIGTCLQDTMDSQWVYPGVSIFSWDTVRRRAEQANMTVQWDFRIRTIFRNIVPKEVHDWVVFRRGGVTGIRV